MKTLILAILFAVSASLAAQTITISGHYRDKLNQPIAGAQVDYFRMDEALTTSTTTLPDGSFALSFTITALPERSQNAFVTPPAPNPFSGTTQFSVQVQQAAAITITDVQGRHVDRLQLPGAGLWQISWGGMNRIGKSKPQACMWLPCKPATNSTANAWCSKAGQQPPANCCLAASRQPEKQYCTGPPHIQQAKYQPAVAFLPHHRSRYSLWRGYGQYRPIGYRAAGGHGAY